MQTSYYSNLKNLDISKCVSIAGKAPDFYTGREFKTLAPKYWFFKKYKEDHDVEFYTQQFQKEVLDPLDPQEIYNELGQDSIILCWEAPDKFCHRHLVAKWLENALNIKIEEVKK